MLECFPSSGPAKFFVLLIRDVIVSYMALLPHWLELRLVEDEKADEDKEAAKNTGSVDTWPR